MIDAILVAAAVVYLIASFLLFVLGSNMIALSVVAWRRGQVALDSAKQGQNSAGQNSAGQNSIGLNSASQNSVGQNSVGLNTLPPVTVQLPIYNELYVAERVIRAAAALDYPVDLLQIQVLDDSTDETRLLVAEVVEELAAQGFNICHLHRTARIGYKAGALAEGLPSATGRFIAIFDADFMPKPDFLHRTLGEFDDPTVAFVQGRWGHINRDYSMITRLQSLAIDAHFLVEQTARKHKGFWFNFNGTAGIWRTDAIIDAGGWTADTLTEDLDLSYRAHLAGWRGQYRADVEVPGELPYQIASFRRQQHRWARGSLECAAKLLPSVWRTNTSPLTKFEATTHLTAYSIHLLLFTLALLYPLVVAVGQRFEGYETLYGLGYLFAVTSIAPGVFFITGQQQLGRRWTKDLPRILAVTVLGSGLMLNTVRAAVEIFTKPNPEFERTAKYGIGASDTGQQARNSRYLLGFDRIVYGEFALGLYTVVTAWLAAGQRSWGVFLYAAIFTAGLWSMAALTVGQTLLMRRGGGEGSNGNDAIMLESMAEPLVETLGSRAVLIMAKQPIAGSSKTRLIPTLTPDEAAELSQCFIADAVHSMIGLAERLPGTTIKIAGSPTDSQGYFGEVLPGVGFVAQEGKTLGDRLDHVLSATLADGSEMVTAINGDSPTLPSSFVEDAFQRLAADDVDVVFGPAEDGGYYLIGWKRSHPRLVKEVTMSTPTVLADTLVIAEQLGLRVALTEPWYDVDLPEDLERLQRDVDQGTACGPATTAFLSRRSQRSRQADRSGSRLTSS